MGYTTFKNNILCKDIFFGYFFSSAEYFQRNNTFSIFTTYNTLYQFQKLFKATYVSNALPLWTNNCDSNSTILPFTFSRFFFDSNDPIYLFINTNTSIKNNRSFLHFCYSSFAESRLYLLADLLNRYKLIQIGTALFV